ncbi:MAG: sugar ABC transporter substrate-binding protein [Jatrophihabitans sp.]
MRGTKKLALIVPVLLALAACGSVNAVNRPHNKVAGGKGGYGYKIAVITHGGPGDAFWSVVKNGVDQAGKDLGDKISYQSSADPTTQAQYITAAVNQKPDGIVVSMANPEALKSAVEGATKAGIPVIVVNSGTDQWKEYGAQTYIGSDEAVAGQAVGTELKKDGMKNVICVIHEAGNASLEQRCKGVAQTLGGKVTNLQVDINNLNAAQSTIQSKLQQDKSIDGVVTLSAQVSTYAEKGITGASSSAKLATFDLNAAVCKDILAGKILFSVDQQPYLQGYLAVQMLTLYKSNLNVLGGGQPVLTGPSLVTKANAAEVLKLAAGGTR